MPKLKLYYSPGACSLASHMVLEEAGADFEPVKVNFGQAEQRSPDYLRSIRRAACPRCRRRTHRHREPGDHALRGAPLPRREAVAGRSGRGGALHRMAGLDFLDRPSRPTRTSAGRNATPPTKRRRRTWSPRAARRRARSGRWSRPSWAKGPWAAGDRFSVADPYALVFWTWGRGATLGYDMAKDFPNWTAHARRMAERPAVKKAFEREGIDLPA